MAKIIIIIMTIIIIIIIIIIDRLIVRLWVYIINIGCLNQHRVASYNSPRPGNTRLMSSRG